MKNNIIRWISGVMEVSKKVRLLKGFENEIIINTQGVRSPSSPLKEMIKSDYFLFLFNQ
jgi:hypothetical protein